MHCPVCATFSALWIVLILLTDVTSSLEVKISPEYKHDNFEDPIVVKCVSEHEMPITACQFRVWMVGVRKEGALLNATDGYNVSVENTSPDATYFAHYQTDFTTGLCQVSLQGVPGNHLLVGCKLTTPSNKTAVKTMPIFRTHNSKLNLEVNNQQSAVPAGGDVDILVKSRESDKYLTKCTSTLPNIEKLQINLGYYSNIPNTLIPANSRYKLSGDQRSKGECGFTIKNVQAGDNGVFFVVAEQGQRQGVKAVTVIVTQPPSRIELSLYTEPEGFTVGDSITATCSLYGVRVSDELAWTWTLGGRTLRNASKGYSNPAWSWPWQDANVSQSVTWTLEHEHDGLDIGCHVEGLNDTVTIKFLAEPVAATTDRHLTVKVTGASVAMLLLTLVVAVVAVAAVRRCAGQQYTDLKSPTPKDDHLRRARPPRAATQDVHPTNGRRPNNQKTPAPNRGQRPPVTAARSAPRVAPQTSSHTQVVDRAAQGQAGLKVNLEDGNKALPRPGRTAALVSPQTDKPSGVEYVNAAAISHNHPKADDTGVEYLNVAQAKVPSQTNLPQTSPKVVPKITGKTKQSLGQSQRAQPLAPVQSQQAPQKTKQDSPQKLPRATAKVRPTPRPAVASQGVPPLIRGKEDIEQVVYAELRLPAVRRKAPMTQEAEVDYAELDWSK